MLARRRRDRHRRADSYMNATPADVDEHRPAYVDEQDNICADTAGPVTAAIVSPPIDEAVHRVLRSA